MLLDKLRKSANDLLLRQVNQPKDLVKIAGNIKYKIKEVLAVKKQRNQLKY